MPARSRPPTMNDKAWKLVPWEMREISAIISTYNAANLIRGCLEDLQTKPSMKRVILRSWSSIGFIGKQGEIVLEFQKKNSNRVPQNRSARINLPSMESRIRMAKGRYRQCQYGWPPWCDSLEKLALALDDDDEAVIAYGDSRMTRRAKTVQKRDFPNREFFPSSSYTPLRLPTDVESQSTPQWVISTGALKKLPIMILVSRTQERPST